jgi:putative NADPH-quinone reductase
MNIVIIQGHPDAGGGHFCHALADAYAEGGQRGGHEVRRIAVAALGLPLVASKAEWDKGTPPEAVLRCQEDIGWAQHLLIVYPLWLGSMPAVLKGFFEQVLRPGFAVAKSDSPGTFRKKLKGRSGRVVVTMGMPALAYRWYFRAHSLKSLERNILRFVGIAPIRESLIGMVESGGPAKHQRWLETMRVLGKDGR